MSSRKGRMVVVGAASFALGSLALTGNVRADLLAQWTFETSIPTTAGPHAAEGGLNAGVGSPANGVHADGLTVYSNPAGNLSAESFSADRWAVGDYWQFSTSTTGFQNISIQWDQTGSNTGPRDFEVRWSTDNSTYTAMSGTLNVLFNGAPNQSWGAATGGAVYTMGPFSGPAALDNQGTVFFRVIDLSTTSVNGGTVATAGTDRIDNVLISGDPIPEPTSLGLLCLGGLLGARRRRS